MPSLEQALAGRMHCTACHRETLVYEVEKKDVLRNIETRLAMLTEAVLMLGAAVSAETLPEMRPTKEQWNALVERLCP